MLRAGLWVALTAGVALGQGRPARGLPAPTTRGFEARVLEVWPEGKRPTVLESGRRDVVLEAQPQALLPSLSEGAAPTAAAGSAEALRLELPTGELEVLRCAFPSPAEAEAYACFGVDLTQPGFVERRGAELVLLRGPALGQATATAVGKLRDAAWAPTKGGLAAAAPWGLVAVIPGDGGFALLNRGEGVLQEQLLVTRDKAREKAAELDVEWLDAPRREVLALRLSAVVVEVFAHADRGTAVLAARWEQVEGLKAFARQVLGRALPPPPADADPARWTLRHRMARLSGTSSHPTPVLLTRTGRRVEAGTASGPAQAGLAEGLEEGAAPERD